MPKNLVNLPTFRRVSGQQKPYWMPRIRSTP